MKKYIYFLIYVTNQEQQKREEREAKGFGGLKCSGVPWLPASVAL